ncbi:MAG: hypothetical protein C0468_00375 [Planctomyces sp.]|nr:hypothetical protein [Planctomyces sp.]
MPFNQRLADELARMASCMELLGVDAFRVRAHQRAARAIESDPTDLRELIDRSANEAAAKAALRAIEGVGDKIADKALEFARDGAIAEARQLAGEVPAGLLALLEVPGLGPKTLRALWQGIGVTDAASLKRAIHDGTILTVPRMGNKAVDKIRHALMIVEESAGRLRLGPAWAVAARIVEHMRRQVGVVEAQFAGSLRRGRESVGDIDVLIAARTPEDAEGAHGAFVAMPGVTAVLASGKTRSSVRVAIEPDPRWEPPTGGDGSGGGPGPGAGAAAVPSVQADLRTVPPESWGAALMYFTGSKDHNVQLRGLAQLRGLTLNEYGLFPDEPGQDKPPQQRGVRAIAARTEGEVYAALGLPELPPELREGRGELGLAAAPGLVREEDIRAELHAHTTASDGWLSVVGLAERARLRGFHTVAVTDHSRSSTIARGLDAARLRAHVRAVHEARSQVSGITILAGSEVDILADGSLDYDDDLLGLLDVVVASPHASLDQPPAVATARLLRAIEHPRVRVLGHPTGRLVLRRAGLEPAMGELFAAAREHGVALEINAHWMRLDLRDTHARAAAEAGCLIAINCDVHAPEDFDNLRFGVMTARRAWIGPGPVVNTWPAERLHAWLRSGRPGAIT